MTKAPDEYKSCSLLGVVLDNQSNPLEEVTVMIEDSPGDIPDMAAITNEEGEFAFHYLSPGKTVVRLITYDSDFRKEYNLSEKITRVTIKLE